MHQKLDAFHELVSCVHGASTHGFFLPYVNDGGSGLINLMPISTFDYLISTQIYLVFVPNAFGSFYLILPMIICERPNRQLGLGFQLLELWQHVSS